MFGARVDAELMQFARFVSGAEVCGFIDAAGNVVSVPNVAADPSEAWAMPAGSVPLDARAVWHTHPQGPACPSGADMQFAIASAMPHAVATIDGVVWFGEGVPRAPLVGRPFRHGVTDCYSLIRDFYHMAGADIPDFPRDWKWWKKGRSLYLDGFREAGFRDIPAATVQPGDGLMFAIGSTVPNHAGVFLGDGLMLHHLSSKFPVDYNRRSTVCDVAEFGRFLAKAVRYENGHFDRSACKAVRLHILA